MEQSLPTISFVVILLFNGVCTSLHDTDVYCDVAIAGGSTASLAAAITAAEADHNLTVCFTDITDWPGGQLTSEGVSAIDFGQWITDSRNQAASFQDLVNFIPGNPGACSVSSKCFQPNWLVNSWIIQRLNRSSNLKVFLRTVIISTQRKRDGSITSLMAIQRTPKNVTKEYKKRLSEELNDWYSTKESSLFLKKILILHAKVFIEATEFGDVLATSGLKFLQGVEIPTESSWNVASTCGQASTLTFFMSLNATSRSNLPDVPAGNDAGQPFTPLSPTEWMFSWVYRRAYCSGNHSLSSANIGDTSQQNLGNDLDTGYLFLSLNETQNQRPWMGGVNLTSLQLLEDRAYGYFWLMFNDTPTEQSHLVINRTSTGTIHGLSKLPYLRDTRRAIGLDNFRLMYESLAYYNSSSPYTAYRFHDTIALGNYNDDIHKLEIELCNYPKYLLNHTTKPFYIPFRALTVQNVSNLLVAGKTMAQTFHANGATRVHPSEWSSGVAAGGAAVLMVRRRWSSRDVYNNVTVLQAFLNSSAVGQPLEWTPPHNQPPQQIGFSCALEKWCIGVDHQINGTVYSNATCNGACSALDKDEWLAFHQYWEKNKENQTITSLAGTTLKKSIAQTSVLPNWEMLPVKAGTTCTLVTHTPIVGYYLCRLS